MYVIINDHSKAFIYLSIYLSLMLLYLSDTQFLSSLIYIHLDLSFYYHYYFYSNT